MFDLKPSKASEFKFDAEIPGLDEDWQIGVITGPSGSGKTTIARRAFGQDFYINGEWETGKAIVDGFGDYSIKDITFALTAVGFSSPPAWLRPYEALSNGEKFRCDLARALLMDRKLLVFDEFTSLVDRNVAKIGAAAIGKAIRRNKIKSAGETRRFVAVSCHEDFIKWLQPDWVLNMASGRLVRGAGRRPPIKLKICLVTHSAWDLFSRHHYLSEQFAHSNTCFCAFWEGRPVAFISIGAVMGYPGYFQISRVVVLPDYQGVGIGSAARDAVAEIVRAHGKRLGMTTSHPAMIVSLKSSPNWRCCSYLPNGSAADKNTSGATMKRSTGRAVSAFVWRGPIASDKTANEIMRSPTELWLRRMPRATAKELVALTGFSITKVCNWLNQEMKSGKIIREGFGVRRVSFRYSLSTKGGGKWPKFR